LSKKITSGLFQKITQTARSGISWMTMEYLFYNIGASSLAERTASLNKNDRWV
jgi:hypothetical protein